MIRGISMIELIIALMVMTMAVMVSTSTGIMAPNIIADARSASAALENARASLASFGGDVVFEPLEDEHFIQQTVHGIWTTSRGIPRSIDLSAVVSTSTEPEACDPFTSGDWSRPVLAQNYTLDSLDVPAGSYSISSLAISPSMLAIGIGSTSQASASTLLLFQLNGTSAPQLVRMFDNASTSRIGNTAVVSHGKTVFSGNAFSSTSSSTCSDGMSCAQVSVHSLDAAGLVSSLTLSTSSEPFAYRSDGSAAPISALAYYRGLVYVGLQKTVSGDEFNIIDAHDPAHLTWMSGYPVGRTVNSISVRDGLAYAGTDDPSRELILFTVADPTRPTIYTAWDAPGSSTFGYGSASTAYENSVRFGRTYSASNSEFELLQVDGTTTHEAWQLDSGTSQDPESVRALLTQDRLTFMLLTHRMDVLDTHDSAHVHLIGSYALPPGSQGIALVCRNNRLYLGRNGSDGNGHIDILQGS